jgi:hypothetical protein
MSTAEALADQEARDSSGDQDCSDPERNGLLLAKTRLELPDLNHIVSRGVGRTPPQQDRSAQDEHNTDDREQAHATRKDEVEEHRRGR